MKRLQIILIVIIGFMVVVVLTNFNDKKTKSDIFIQASPQVIESSHIEMTNRIESSRKACVRKEQPDRTLHVFKENQRFGFMNKEGEVIIPPKFNAVSPFSEGMAGVYFNNRFIYINEMGETLLDIGGLKIAGNPFKEGLATVRSGTQMFFIDKYGNSKFDDITRESELIRSFNEGYRLIKMLNGKVGFINRAGEWAIKPNFEDALSFSSGLAAVKSGGRWGYMNQSGQMVIPYMFDGAGGFSECMAAVKINNKFGYIDREGTVRINP